MRSENDMILKSNMMIGAKTHIEPMKKYFFLPILFSFILTGCTNHEPSEKTVAGQALGTTYHITYFSEEEFQIENGLDSVFEAMNQSMSTYLPSSDISRINRGDSLVEVDSLFQQVFALSKKIFLESEGYFDPTVGDLVNMYGFGPEQGLMQIDSSSIDSLMQYVGLEKIEITSEGLVLKEFPETYLDFNAIAKGYTVDLIGLYLDQNEVENYLVELGGELLAKGKNISKNANWTIGIDDPNQEQGNRTLQAVVELNNRAMATSGNYRKFRIDPETGEKYVHTINPLTGYPEKSNLLSVSVFAENCALADGYATAFMAMGLEKSKALLEDLEQVDAYFIYSEKNEIEEFVTEGVQIK